MTSEEATALFQLRCLWQDAYHIGFSDVWSAKRLNHPTTILTADTAAELRGLIQDDYADWLSADRTAQ
jgi:hypothetical protein